MSKKVISTWVPESVANKIDDLVQKGEYNNRSDYLRSLIRRELEAHQ